MRVENSVAMNDYMTGTLRSIIRTMNMMISNMQVLDQRARVLGAGAFNGMNQQILEAEINLNRMEAQLRDVDLAQRRAASGASTWAMKLTGVFSAVSLLRMAFGSLSKFMTMTDQYTNANARLNLINDGLMKQKELQDAVLQSSRDTRASYLGTADLVAKIGMTGAMKSTQDAIDMAAKVNKLLVIGGGGAQQNEAALLQFSQALSSGRMQGDEFRSLRENAPALMATIAKGMDVPIGSLKQLSTQGALTTEAIIQALENMGTNIDEQFAAMPVTFGQNMQMIKDSFGLWMAEMAENGALKKLNDLFARLNAWLIGDGGQKFFDGLSSGLYVIVYLLETAVNVFSYLGEAIEALGPVSDAVFWGLLTLGVILLAQHLAVLVAQAINTGIAFMTALGPAGWIILGVSAAVGGLIVWLNHLGVTASDIFTAIGGFVGGLFAFIVNQVIFGYNIFAAFADFVMNIFVDPVYAVKKLFYDLITNVSDYFGGLINGIVDGLNWIINKANEIAGTSFDVIDHITTDWIKPPDPVQNAVDNSMDFVSYDKFASKGADFANGFLNKITDIDPFGAMGGAGSYNVDQVASVGKVGKIDSDINIAEEDIKLLMDAVTQRYVNQVNLTVQTAAPIIQANGTVREEADIERVVAGVAEMLAEERTISVEMASTT